MGEQVIFDFRSRPDKMQSAEVMQIAVKRFRFFSKGVPQMVRGELTNFPGPLTLFPSRKKYWDLILVGLVFTYIGVAMILRDGPTILPVLGTVFFGSGVLAFAINLVPGASSLKLDSDSFDVVKFFRKKTYYWSDVGDFEPWTFHSRSLVTFKATKSHLGILGKINAALANGRNGYLPDTYGMAVHDLVQLMSAWQSSALGRKSMQGFAPSCIAVASGVNMPTEGQTTIPQKAAFRLPDFRLPWLTFALLAALFAIFGWEYRFAATPNVRSDPLADRSVQSEQMSSGVPGSLGKCAVLFPAGQGAAPGLNCTK